MVSSTQSNLVKKASTKKAEVAKKEAEPMTAAKAKVLTKPTTKPAAKIRAKVTAESDALNERLRALALRCAHACADKKAEDVVILDVGGLTSYADYFVLCSGRAERQVQAIGNHVLTELKAAGVKPFGFEGLEEGQWGLIDCGDVIVHVFSQEARAHYDLDGLWADGKRVLFEDA